MPADDDNAARWRQCQADWLNQIERRSGKTNSRRAYEADVKDYETTTGAPIWHATSTTAEAFAQALAKRGLAPATVNRKLSALASLYRYAEEEGLVALNPFLRRSLRRPRPSTIIDFPTTEQIAEMFERIDTSTPTGLRNLALLAGLFATTRRISEFIGLRWGDVSDGYFVYRNKGGHTKQQQMPPWIWQIILDYLTAAHRLPMAADDYIFVALSDNGQRLHPDQKTGPLNPGYVAKLIKRYGLAAGIPARALYPHALRHAGAQHRHENHAELVDIQDILGHKSPTTTLGYLRKLARRPDPQADLVAQVLPRRIVRQRGEAR